MGLIDTDEAVEHFRRVIEATTNNNDAYNEGFIDALEFCITTLSTMPAADQWIPVSKRLPEDGVDVLVTDDAGGMATIEIDCMESRESLAALGIDCAENYKKCWWSSQNVTAWMPLPNCYQGDKHEVVKELKRLPSSQPEPERFKSCKNCIHLGHGYMMPCKNCRRNQMMPDWYEAET